jgi:release factor glutamine methyltransferase
MQRAKAGHRTLREAVGAATAELERAGVASPRHDAERLAALAVGTTWSGLWTLMDDGLPSGRLEELVRRRGSGEPLAYIQGSTVFCGLEMACGPGVLVPRPETEVLVEVASELIEPLNSPLVVDVGTGSGAIAVALSQRRPDARIYGTDSSEVALQFAVANAARHGCDIDFRIGDLTEPLPSSIRGRVDLLVSNPPYVPNGAELPADVRAEPAEALFAGPSGDEVLRRIVTLAPRCLKQGGALALEIGEERQAGVLEGANLRRDLTGRGRVIWQIFE